MRWVALGAFGGLHDQVAGFRLEGFEVLEVAVEATGVRAEELVAFAFLDWLVMLMVGVTLVGRAREADLLFGRGPVEETADGVGHGV